MRARLAGTEREARYRELLVQTESVLSGETDPVVWMATLSCLVYQAFDFLWVGFYRTVQGGLLIGPYQGTLGCLRISYERGVCGASARERKVIIVPDVHAFPGHIACDSRSRSEIVLPVFDRQGALRAVFDLDSERPEDFDALDEKYLGKLLEGMKGLDWSRENSRR